MTSIRNSILRRVSLVAMLGALSLALGVSDADARRMGGGKSFGRQSSSAMQQRAQQPPSRESMGQSGQQNAQPAQPAPAAQQPARPAGNRWLGPLAGLAAGLGIAALLSHFGLAGPFASMLGSLLIIGLLIFAALFIWRMLRSGATPPVQRRMEPAYGGTASSPPLEPAAAAEQPPVLGNARAGSVAATLGGAAVATAAPSAANAVPPGVPADFDVEGFLRNTKVHFHRLQSAWDRKDLQDIQTFTTPEVFAEIRMQLAEETGSNYTEVADLHADLLGIEETATDWLASVRLTGDIREAPGAAAAPFKEIWNLAKRKDGSSGWLLAGIEQLQ